jgi:hypothetical protein
LETGVRAIFEGVEDILSENVRPCDIQKLIKSLKLRKACGIDGIPNECLEHLPRRQLVYLTHLINHCLILSQFPEPWKEAKVITLPKPVKDPEFTSDKTLAHCGQTQSHPKIVQGKLRRVCRWT